MKAFEVLNRLAWLWLVLSFMVKKDNEKYILQVIVFIFLLLSFILEILGV